VLAIVYAPGSPNDLQLQLREVPEPRPAPHQLHLDVRATSLNFGEIAYLTQRQQAGHVLGNDASGVVLAAAADGYGRPAAVPTCGTSCTCCRGSNESCTTG